MTRRARATSRLRSTALRKPAHVALGAALDERELRPTVGAGTDEVPLRRATLERRSASLARDDAAHRHRPRATRRPRPPRLRPPRLGEQVLLDALPVLHPLLDRDADGVRHGEHLVGPEADGTVRRDAPELAVDLPHRDPRAEPERDQPPDRFHVGHERAARLAEGDEDLKRLAAIVLR